MVRSKNGNKRPPSKCFAGLSVERSGMLYHLNDRANAQSNFAVSKNAGPNTDRATPLGCTWSCAIGVLKSPHISVMLIEGSLMRLILLTLTIRTQKYALFNTVLEEPFMQNPPQWLIIGIKNLRH